MVELKILIKMAGMTILSAADQKTQSVFTE